MLHMGRTEFQEPPVWPQQGFRAGLQPHQSLFHRQQRAFPATLLKWKPDASVPDVLIPLEPVLHEMRVCVSNGGYVLQPFRQFGTRDNIIRTRKVLEAIVSSSQRSCNWEWMLRG